MDLSLRQVRAFVSVVQAGSFTRAAALLNLSQPALTVQLRRLEEALDARLLDRTSRRVAPTRLGRELLPVFQRVLRMHHSSNYGGTSRRLCRRRMPSWASW